MILSSSLINREFRATAVYLCIFYHIRHLMHKKSIAGLAWLCFFYFWKVQTCRNEASLKLWFKHTCKIGFVWYNNLEDRSECTDSILPSQYVPLSPSGISTPLSPFIFTLSRKRAARRPPFSCAQDNECDKRASDVLWRSEASCQSGRSCVSWVLLKHCTWWLLLQLLL